ncbi:D-alanyl-D-alanine dipeptidase [Hymenobacter oligotrophus]|uniref:D-alanyl-D-alanine dipeptidase n=1 Tax=Hymenobacter oligotrophus TaxID=2319843 RepID=A0A3B7QXA2_9BACT|nr:M15 family metallopeptidase [Hymenobacter oligotrophus]AYA35730.1 D-alanyl-D-alanine dipeptidase [Hymenobacter oligotrophus]
MPAPEIPLNSYGLPVLTNAAQYWQLVRLNPEHELIDLGAFIPSVQLDIRYATANNFLGEAVYAEPAAYLRRPVAEALGAAQRELAQVGVGLKVFDAYRPYSATVRFFEKIPDETYAAPPWRGSRHNRGCSVDAALIDLGTGADLPMPTEFDALGPEAHSDYPELPTAVLQHRALLHTVLAQHGFVNYRAEWWHFDHQRWADFPLLDLAFAELRR